MSCNVSNFNVGQYLLMASNMMKRRLDHEVYEVTKDDSISGANTQIVGYLVANSSSEIYQKDIEKAFSLRPSTVSANLRLMEKKGFVTRKYSTVDTRLKRVLPTEKAVELNEKVNSKGYELEENFKKVLSVEEQDILMKLLKKVISALE